MKQNLDFTEIKEFCDKVGLNCQIIDEGVIITKPKDIWDGVEFALNPKGFVRKIEKIEHVLIYFIGDFWYHKNVCNPSTEQAYIEQLKKEANERFGEIKEGDRFKLPNDGIDKVVGGSYEFDYSKETDRLYLGLVKLYDSGKWATRVKEMVKVIGAEMNKGSIIFHYTGKIDKMIGCISSQLEKYLNGEIK